MLIGALETLIPPELFTKICKAGSIHTLDQVIQSTSSEIQKALKISVKDADRIRKTAISLVQPLTVTNTAHDVLLEQSARLSFGCKAIDSLLKGGLISGTVTEMYGESSCGKTQLCLQLTIMCQRQRSLPQSKCLYICTEDTFPSQRLMQICREQNKLWKTETNFTDNIFIEHICDCDHLISLLETRLPPLLKQGRVKLLIIDSITALFRGRDQPVSGLAQSREVSGIGSCLKYLAATYNIYVLVINQVTAVMDNPFSLETSKPALGLTWSNLINTRLQIRRKSPESLAREMVVKFSPHLANDSCYFTISTGGVIDMM